MEHENYQVESQRDLLNCVLMLKDVRAKSKFLVHRYLFKIVTTVRYWVTCVSIAKRWGVTDFVTEIKRVENYLDFEKLAHVIQRGLQEFTVKNIERQTEANDLSHIL